MRQKDNRNFFGKILTLTVLVLAGIMVLGYIWKKGGPKKDKPEVALSVIPTTESHTKPGWEIYTNKKFKFSFSYPADWVVEDTPEGDEYGKIVSLRSPETIRGLEAKEINPGYSNDLCIYYWRDINNEYARGGSWVGEWRYAGLEDFFRDKNALTHKVGDITVAGGKAYEVSIGGYGANYGVMIERDGIYELSFETAWDKSELSQTQKQILATFQFSY